MEQRLDPVEEKNLVDLMLTGDESAFDRIYRIYHGPVFRFAVKMTGSHATSEEILQEVFLSLVQKGEAFDPRKGRLIAYLYGITRNKVHRSFSTGQGREKSLESEAQVILNHAVALDDPAADLAKKEEIENLRRGILSLPERYREVIALCDLSEMSYEEAADIIQCSLGTVRSRLHRGRSLLIEKMRATVRPAIQCGTARPAGGYL